MGKQNSGEAIDGKSAAQHTIAPVNTNDAKNGNNGRKRERHREDFKQKFPTQKLPTRKGPRNRAAQSALIVTVERKACFNVNSTTRGR